MEEYLPCIDNIFQTASSCIVYIMYMQISSCCPVHLNKYTNCQGQTSKKILSFTHMSMFSPIQLAKNKIMLQKCEKQWV